MKPTTDADKTVLWLVLSILSFAVLGAILAKVLSDFQNYQTINLSQQSFTDAVKSQMLAYAGIGAVIGLFIGIVNALYRNNKSARIENR